MSLRKAAEEDYQHKKKGGWTTKLENALYESLQAALNEPNWISVSDRLPEADERHEFLGCIALRPSGMVDVERSHPSWWNKKNALERIESPVTHWMPLPSPPEQS